MKENKLESVSDIAYIFLEKSKKESSRISYNKLQCMLYQSNKAYYKYKNELIYNINSMTSEKGPINMAILAEFSDFRTEKHISYTSTEDHKDITIDVEQNILLEYIWHKYSPMSDHQVITYTLEDKIFESTSGVNITEDSLKDGQEDKDAKNLMEFLGK